MTQETESRGWEGWLAPADWMAFNLSGGKPPFPTTSCSFLIISRTSMPLYLIEG